jgi:hypothetical protein
MNPNNGQEMPREPESVDAEFNRIAREEEEKENQRLEKAREIPSDEDLMKELRELNASVKKDTIEPSSQLKKINQALKVLDRYASAGLTDDMSIGQAAEFLDREKAALGAAGEGSAEENALSVIVANMEDGLTENSALGEIRTALQEKKWELKATMRSCLKSGPAALGRDLLPRRFARRKRMKHAPPSPCRRSAENGDLPTRASPEALARRARNTGVFRGGSRFP